MLDQITQIFLEAMQQAFPPVGLTVSEWADRNRQLSADNCAEPGDWKTSRVPYLREVMDVWTDPSVREIVLMKPSRLGGTAATLNIFGRIVACDPGPVLWLWPDLGAGGKFSELELDPMCRDTPCLQGKISTEQSNKKGNKVLQKSFPGGSLVIVGANKPAGLAQLTIRDLICDEIDRYTKSAGKEGNPIELARKRTTTFPNKKVFLCSSPTKTGESPIETYYLQSDQRVFEVPCPHCDFYQELKLSLRSEEGRLIQYQLRWDSPTSPAYYVCEHCAGVIEHHEKTALVTAGRWRARAEFTGVAGFRLSGLVSPWRSWDEIRDDFLRSKGDREKLKVFVNTVLGETFDENRQDIPIKHLADRQVVYHCEAPDGVLLITAGGDVQGNRIEVSVWGWGAGWQSWALDHHIFYGDPLRPEVWAEVEAALLKTYQATHKELKIECAFFDAKDGNRAEAVYTWTKQQNSRGRPWYSSGGGNVLGKPILSPPSKQGQARTIYYEVCVNTVKDELAGSLAVIEPGPRYVNFPARDNDRYQHFGDEFFLQLCAEQAIDEVYRGRIFKRWKKRRTRNEVLDCLVYARAAAQKVRPNFTFREAERLKTLIEEKTPEKTPEKPAKTPQPRQRRGNFATNWK